MKGIVALIVGLLFSLGLGASGMTRPDIVKGFLDIFGGWDPRLLGVMGGAIAVHAVAYRLIMRRTSPLLDTHFHVPIANKINLRLLSGAAIFGIGWGWAGICPGPGIVAMVSGRPAFLYFVLSMLVSMKIFMVIERKLYIKEAA